ncbi:hypothetical protein MP638_004687, partial [Amoeboaphelidium occidentale]
MNGLRRSRRLMNMAPTIDDVEEDEDDVDVDVNVADVKNFESGNNNVDDDYVEDNESKGAQEPAVFVQRKQLSEGRDLVLLTTGLNGNLRHFFAALLTSRQINYDQDVLRAAVEYRALADAHEIDFGSTAEMNGLRRSRRPMNIAPTIHDVEEDDDDDKDDVYVDVDVADVENFESDNNNVDDDYVEDNESEAAEEPAVFVQRKYEKFSAVSGGLRGLVKNKKLFPVIQEAALSRKRPCSTEYWTSRQIYYDQDVLRAAEVYRAIADAHEIYFGSSAGISSFLNNAVQNYEVALMNSVTTTIHGRILRWLRNMLEIRCSVCFRHKKRGTAGAKCVMSYLAWQANERADEPEFLLLLETFLARNDDLCVVVLAALLTARFIKKNWYNYFPLRFHLLSYFNAHSIADAQIRLLERRRGRGLRTFTLAPLTKMRNEFILNKVPKSFPARLGNTQRNQTMLRNPGKYWKDVLEIYKLSNSSKTFGFSIKTDGVSARVHFKKTCYTTDVGKDGFKTVGDKEYVQLNVENKRCVMSYLAWQANERADEPEFLLLLETFLARNDDLCVVVLAALLTARFIKKNWYNYFPLRFHLLSYFNAHSIADAQIRLLERRRGRGLRTFTLAPLTKMRNEFILNKVPKSFPARLGNTQRNQTMLRNPGKYWKDVLEIYKLSNSSKTFGFSIKTDGVSARVHFKKTCYTTDVGKDGFKTVGDKEYVQLNVENKRVVGLDPGRKDIFSCFDGTKAVHCSNKEWQEISAGMPSSKVCSEDLFISYLTYELQNFEVLDGFYRSKQWRQLGRKTDIRRQKAYDFVCKRIAGINLDSVVAFGSAGF